MIIITPETQNFIIWDKTNKRRIEVDTKRISAHEWRGLCPFHADSEHPNLDINDLKRMYVCRACHVGGHLYEPGFENKKKPIQDIYNYEDEKGELIYQVVRYEDKDFKQRRPDGKGGWIWNLKDVKKILFNLSELVQKPGNLVFIPEGEKDCLNLKKLGILATTNSGGAGKWPKGHNKYFKDREVIIPPDKDDTGENHLQIVGKDVMETAKRIRVLRLPGLSKGEDISDWIERGGTLEELFELLKTAPEFIPRKEEEREELKIITTGDFRPTDLWNSENFFKKYEGQLLYCKKWNSWLIYRGGKWQEDDRNESQELAKKVIMGYYREASEMLDDKERKKIVDQARKSESQRAIRAMTELATSSMATVPDDFDRGPFIFNLKNGTLGLETMEFREHKAEDMLMKITEISYKPEADCPKWLAFLNKIFEGNNNLIDYLQTALGYSLTGDIGEQCWFILYGIGANGKTTFINVILEILGDYAINTPFETFLSRGKFGNIPNDLARMKGARFVSASEAGENRKFNESLLKDMVGSNIITARFLRQEFFDFKPECKIWLATNHKPLVREFSLGFWRKVRLIPFKIVIPEEERILNYDKILLEEKEGIFNWILEGFKKWKEEGGLKTPEEIIEATAEYKSSMDVIAEWIEECCNENHKVRTTTKELYDSYKIWCGGNNEDPIKSRVFGRRLEERGYKSVKIGKGRDRGWQGIELKNKGQESLPISD